MVALKELATKSNTRLPLHNKTSSKYILHNLSLSFKKNEDAGFIGVPNKEIIQATIASLRSRKQTMMIEWIKKADRHPDHDKAKLLVIEGVEKQQDNTIKLDIDPKLKITGAALNKLSQNRAYKAFHENANIKLAIEGAKECFKINTTKAEIWKSIRSRDIDRSTRYLLWMMIHDAYRIGVKWLNFGPQYHPRAYCSHCNNNIENMCHILTECSSPGQKEIWELTKELLEQRDIPWCNPNILLILACTSPTFKSQNGHREYRKERFFKIVVSSSVQTIWNTWCERVIQQDNIPFTPEEIRNRWMKKINRRLELDCLMTKERFGKKALRKDLVIQTWAGSILNEHQLPQDWTEVGGVLVGMG
ncbi:hypothetical protein ARMGADRAFT_1048260 [Armillaria gallica]|uniref:Reverse transcriptase zinc-binding domain-containing protein n=1 Tax=Armillaria gallica TaxID=47427 RepID=A0A2H3D5D7_ARMGA|nr:hypothetical protein ARMGADRAFT_1048260 [Armillaria gallica]